MENLQREENYLLFVPSLMSRTQVIHYKVTGWENEYSGMQTNEAVTKYLIDYLESKGAKLDKIIMLCSDEVENQKLELDQVSGRTTLEYYKGVILDFYKARGYDKIDEEELFEVVSYIPKNDGEPEEIVEPLKKVLQITGEGESESGKHLFVDFTGGLRSAALLLLFACRILQKSGIKVEKILYSQIYPRTDQGVLEECTGTYQIFEHFEAQIEEKHGGSGTLKKMAQKIENPVERAQLQKTIKIQEEMNTADKQNQLEIVEQKARELDKELEKNKEILKSNESKRIQETLSNNSGRQAKNIADKGPFGHIQNHINKGEYDKAFNLFREKIVRILYDAKLLKVCEWYRPGGELKENLITNELMGAYSYYENPKSKTQAGWHTFMDAVHDYIRHLCAEPDREPEEILKERYGKSFYNLGNYLEDVPKKGFAHTDFSRRTANKKIFPCLRESCKSAEDLEDVVEKHCKMDQIYMNYGFPFACTYDRWFFARYDEEYKRVFESGADSLQKFYFGRTDKKIRKIQDRSMLGDFSYETLIQALNKKEGEEWLYILFPFRLWKNNICRNEKNKEIGEGEWEEFIYQFVKSFYLIKNVRNKITHASNLKDGEAKGAVEELKKVMGILEKYIR